LLAQKLGIVIRIDDNKPRFVEMTSNSFMTEDALTLRILNT